MAKDDMAKPKSFAAVSQGNKMGVFPFKKTAPPKTRERLEHVLALQASSQAASDKIRAQHGLDPVPANSVVAGWRDQLAVLPAKKAKRKAPLSKVERSLNPDGYMLTPTEKVREIADRRKALEREREAIDAEIRDLVSVAQSDRSLKVSAIATALGVSRQRLYQLAG